MWYMYVYVIQYSHWCFCLAEYEYISKGNKRDWFWLYEWQLECLWVFMCMYLCMCVCLWQWQGSSRESFHSVFKQQQGSMQQDSADGGSAGGCWGGWEESHCFKETRFNYRAKHLIQARASTLQPPQQEGEVGGRRVGWLLCSLQPNSLSANKREELKKKTTITACHAA